MKTVGLPISHKENERRRALVPQDICQIKHPEMICVESGYGDVLGFSDEDIERKFGFFVGAFNYGTPPHGGLAFGLDRLTMLLCKDDSIKDVIAFPKVQTAACLMSDAPSQVDEKQLAELGIILDNK